jgi:hypothetical protein
MKAQIRCKVFPGQFSSEYAVEGTQANGENFSLFAPVEDVETDRPVTRERAVEGWLRVTVWKQVGDLMVVRLPGESFECGRFVTVSIAQRKQQPDRIKAAT